MCKRPILFGQDADGEFEQELPWAWAICSACEGHGKSSAYLGAYTQSEMDEAGPEFLEDYMAGHYDRPCAECDGAGKVKVADRSQMTAEQLEQYDAQIKAEIDCATWDHAERLALGGC